MTIVAAIAFIVNLGTALLVKPGSDHDLNQRSAFIHLAGDALSTLGALVAGVLIMLTGWMILDPLVSVFIGLLIVWNAWLIIRESVEILLEGTPRDIDVEVMVKDIQASARRARRARSARVEHHAEHAGIVGARAGGRRTDQRGGRRFNARSTMCCRRSTTSRTPRCNWNASAANRTRCIAN